MHFRLSAAAVVLAASAAAAEPSIAAMRQPCAFGNDRFVRDQLRSGTAADLSSRPPHRNGVSATCLTALLSTPKSLGLPEDAPVEVIGAMIAGPLNLSHREIHPAVTFKHTTFTDRVDLSRTRFRDDVMFDSSTFAEPLTFARAEFAADLGIRGVVFHGGVDGFGAIIGNNLEADSTRFHGNVNFRTLWVKGGIRLFAASVKGDLDFGSAHVGKDLDLYPRAVGERQRHSELRARQNRWIAVRGEPGYDCTTRDVQLRRDRLQSPCR
jgi:hypothetical protein